MLNEQSKKLFLISYKITNLLGKIGGKKWKKN